MFLQELDKIAEHHRMAYLGAEPHDNPGSATTSPTRSEGEAHAASIACYCGDEPLV